MLEIVIENSEINFITRSDLYGLNIFIVTPDFIELENPVITNGDYFYATNISNSIYNVGLASEYSANIGEKIMKIPFTSRSNGELEIDMIINTDFKKVTLEVVQTSIAISHKNERITVFPNPVNDNLNIKGLMVNSKISIYSIQGKELKRINSVSGNESINISDLESGIFIMKVLDSKGEYIQRIVKK